MSDLSYVADLDERYDAATLNVLRAAADITLMFTLCGKLGCRRGAHCRGQPLACLLRHSPAVSEEARSFMARLTQAYRDGFDFDDAWDGLAGDLDHLNEWRAKAAARWHRPTIKPLGADTLRAFYRGLSQVPGGLPPLPCWDE